MAKKRKKRKFSKIRRKHMQSFRKQNEKSGLVSPDMKFVYEPTSEIKLSDALKEIIAPYIDERTSQELYEKVITMCIIAWNATLVSSDEQKKAINEIATRLENDPKRQKEMKMYLKELMARKIALYPEIDRFIIDYQVTDLGDAFHLSIISTLSEGGDS